MGNHPSIPLHHPDCSGAATNPSASLWQSRDSFASPRHSLYSASLQLVTLCTSCFPKSPAATLPKALPVKELHSSSSAPALGGPGIPLHPETIPFDCQLSDNRAAMMREGEGGSGLPSKQRLSVKMSLDSSVEECFRSGAGGFISTSEQGEGCRLIVITTVTMGKKIKQGNRRIAFGVTAQSSPSLLGKGNP